MTKKVERAPRSASPLGDALERPVRIRPPHPVDRRRRERRAPRGERLAAPTLPSAVLTRAPAPRTPTRVQRRGTSTSWVSATAKRAPNQRGGSTPRLARRRSSGGSSGSRHDAAAGKRPWRSRAVSGAARSSTRARWKNASASSSPAGPLAALERGPGLRVVGDAVAEGHVPGPERVEHPAGAPLDRLGDHGRLRASRATAASAGPGSATPANRCLLPPRPAGNRAPSAAQ